MSGQIHIRSARSSDLDVIAEFNARLAAETEQLKLDEATLREGVRRVLNDPVKGSYFIAEIAGQIAGQLMITCEWSDWRNGNIWWIQSVYVNSEYRRRGVFRSLYEHVRSEARRAGAVAMRLYVERNNTSAQETYSELGMKLTNYLVMDEPIP